MSALSFLIGKGGVGKTTVASAYAVLHLLELQMKLETGDITEEQYVVEEAQILRELREIRNRKREMARLPPEDAAGLSGKPQEGSRAEITFTPPPESK